MKKGILIDFGDTIIIQKVDDTAPLSMMKLNLFPDSFQALSRLKDMGFNIILVSNTTQSTSNDVKVALEKLGIGHFFDAVVTSFDVGKEKPAREMFMSALETAGLKPDEALMVGDDLEKDILGAKRIGIDGVLVDRKGELISNSEEYVRIDSLAELPNILKIHIE